MTGSMIGKVYFAWWERCLREVIQSSMLGPVTRLPLGDRTVFVNWAPMGTRKLD